MRAYLSAVDAEAPGLVDGLYLLGSVALGEFRPGTSDIDYLAITAAPLDRAALAALARAHRRARLRHPRPHFDGRYVRWRDLASDPRRLAPGPSTAMGTFRASGGGECDPVAWHTLAAHGVACRGPAPQALTIWTDPGALRSWTLDNFAHYWRPLIAQSRGVGSWRLTSFSTYGAVWIVLGVCRLHYTLASGSIASKAQAGEYGLRTFPDRWHRVLREALRIRATDTARADFASACAETLTELGWGRGAGGSLYESPAARRREVLAFADMVIADAELRFGDAAGVRPGGRE